MMMRAAVRYLACCAIASSAAAFTLQDDGRALTILDDGRPVLVYRYVIVNGPEAAREKLGAQWGLACFADPVYGLDGDRLTEAFPEDHYHHRGVFWAWPNSSLGERPMNVWLSDNIRQHHEKWLQEQADDKQASIGAQNVWVFDDDAGKAAQVREQVWFTVHPARGDGRAIDFRLIFENVGGQAITILGADEPKGYGGFCFRANSARKPLTFTSARGVLDEDAFVEESPWVDVSSKCAGSERVSGAAIFQHPKNPGFPHDGWLIRGYGFLGASWPHLNPYVLESGSPLELRYRLFIHRGSAGEANVAEAFAEYIRENI